MRKAVIWTVAPAALATVLLVLASGWDAAQSMPAVDPCKKDTTRAKSAACSTCLRRRKWRAGLTQA